MTQTETTAARTPLSNERVLQAAIALADEAGVEALSMRRIAKELGVEAMSLYNHVANKDEILNGIVDLVASEIETPDDLDWKAAVRRSAISARDAYLRHRWASGVSLSRQSGGPASLRRTDWLLRTLREAGFSKDVIYHAFHILDAYVLGFTVQHLSFDYQGADLERLATTFIEKLDDDAYPDAVEHIREHLEPHHGETGGFELGLDMILDGLERTLAAG
jgi:AcrR family transcriptional regulator